MRSLIFLVLTFITSLFAYRDSVVTYYQNGDTILKAALYFPDSGTSRPALLFIHEGGFVRGDRDCFSEWASDYTKLGFVLMGIDYRKMQDGGGYPQTVLDAIHGFEWLSKNSRSMRVDSTRIVLGGSSAGAYLASMVAVRHGLAKAQPKIFGKIKTNLAPVAGTILSYGLYNWERSYWKGEGFVKKSEEKAASPVHYTQYAEAPMLVFAGAKDRLFGTGQATEWVDSLKRYHKEVELFVKPTGDHSGICLRSGDLARYEEPFILEFLLRIKGR